MGGTCGEVLLLSNYPDEKTKPYHAQMLQLPHSGERGGFERIAEGQQSDEVHPIRGDIRQPGHRAPVAFQHLGCGRERAQIDCQFLHQTVASQLQASARDLAFDSAAGQGADIACWRQRHAALGRRLKHGFRERVLTATLKCCSQG